MRAWWRDWIAPLAHPRDLWRVFMAGYRRGYDSVGRRR